MEQDCRAAMDFKKKQTTLSVLNILVETVHAIKMFFRLKLVPKNIYLVLTTYKTIWCFLIG